MPSFSALFAAVLAVTHLATLADASPSACLLSAIQSLPSSADSAAICETYQSAVEGNLASVCSGSDVASAYEMYSTGCSAAGFNVEDLPAMSSTSSTATTTAGTAETTGTGTASSSGASASATGKSDGGLAAPPQPVQFMLSGLVAVGLANLLLL